MGSYKKVKCDVPHCAYMGKPSNLARHKQAHEKGTLRFAPRRSLSLSQTLDEVARPLSEVARPLIHVQDSLETMSQPSIVIPQPLTDVEEP